MKKKERAVRAKLKAVKDETEHNESMEDITVMAAIPEEDLAAYDDPVDGWGAAFMARPITKRELCLIRMGQLSAINAIAGTPSMAEVPLQLWGAVWKHLHEAIPNTQQPPKVVREETMWLQAGIVREYHELLKLALQERSGVQIHLPEEMKKAIHAIGRNSRPKGR